jgi:hypothetical protein
MQLFLLALGGYMVWFAINHWGDSNIAGPIKNMLQGKGLK